MDGIISYHTVDLKQQNRLRVGTDKPKPKVKVQSVSDDDVRKRLLEKPPVLWQQLFHGKYQNQHEK